MRVPSDRPGLDLMIQDVPGSCNPPGLGRRLENDSENSQVDDQGLFSDTERRQHCLPSRPLHHFFFFTQMPSAAINRRFSFLVLTATRIICLFRPDSGEQSRTFHVSGVTVPTRTSSFPRRRARVLCGTSTSTSARRTSLSAISACLATARDLNPPHPRG